MEPSVSHGKHRHHDATPERSPIKRDPRLSEAGACGSKQRKLDLLAAADAAVAVELIQQSTMIDKLATASLQDRPGIEEPPAAGPSATATVASAANKEPAQPGLGSAMTESASLPAASVAMTSFSQAARTDEAAKALDKAMPAADAAAGSENITPVEAVRPAPSAAAAAARTASRFRLRHANPHFEALLEKHGADATGIPAEEVDHCCKQFLVTEKQVKA